MKLSAIHACSAAAVGTILLCASGEILAKPSQFYVTAGVGYAFNEVNSVAGTADGLGVVKSAGKYDVDELSYKANLGYNLSKQWALEAGFYALGNSHYDTAELLANKPLNQQRNYDIQAIQLSALGKASNHHGELFYRIGVLQLTPEATYLSLSKQCADGDRFLGAADEAGLISVCQNDDSLYAGVLGLGFDFYVYRALLLRVEGEYIKGQHDYASGAVHIGLRYNF